MDVLGYNNYTITEDGIIINKNRNTLVKQQNSSNGYKYATLYKDGKKKNMKVHKLVADTYLGANGAIIDHVNRNRSDNRLKNLRISTQLENLHNISVLSNNETGYTGIFIKNNKYLSTFTYNYKSNNKYYELTEKGLWQALFWRIICTINFL
jgi:hypothetical protein